MSLSTAKHLARLARLARDLEHKRVLCMELGRHLELVQNTGTIVDGEKSLQNALVDRIEKGLKILAELEQAQKYDVALKQLSELEDLLSDVEWELAEPTIRDLAEKFQSLQKKFQDYMDEIAEWQKKVDDLRKDLDQAWDAKAPVFKEKWEIQRLQGLIDQAKQASDNKLPDSLADILTRLKNESGNLDKLSSNIQYKAKNAQKFSLQSDLLILKSPLSNHRYQYTILMRTPNEPGSHSINIQDSSPLSEQDRERIKNAIKSITEKINAGLARQFALNKNVEQINERGTTDAEENPNSNYGETRNLSLYDRRISQAIDFSANDLAHDIGDLVYRLIMPEQMERYLIDVPCSITITTDDLELPWELMCAEWSEHRFLCLDRPVARMPMGRALPRAKPSKIKPGDKLRILLIYADPNGNLPEAGREVETIKKGLESNWRDAIDIVVLEGDNAQGQRLNQELRGGTFHVIHYAGHAAFDEVSPDLSGLVLKGDEIFFAQKIRRLLEGRPMVFLNACESGRTRNEQEPQVLGRCLQGPAEGLASSFIYGGAIGCIGALWPIYDLPAAEFAIDFYNRLFERNMIGEAMRQSRNFIREKYPDQITWAAFILYGDPTFRLPFPSRL